MARPVALTGTPGTGKTTVARLLRGRRTVEVAELAADWGLARRLAGGGVEVDLPALVGRARRPGSLAHIDVVVGHLAHLLPLRDVVVLRCDPRELGRRLARRRAARLRRENQIAEATDLVLLEARAPGRRLWEVDTTARSPSSVAREVDRLLARRGPGRYGHVRWLEDPRVTDALLDRRP
jgi:adenylate kinase